MFGASDNLPVMLIPPGIKPFSRESKAFSNPGKWNTIQGTTLYPGEIVFGG
jgi:hypothetical protein